MTRRLRDGIGRVLRHEGQLAQRIPGKRDAGGAFDERILASAGEFAEVLEAAFAIPPPIDPAVIWERLPKG